MPCVRSYSSTITTKTIYKNAKMGQMVSATNVVLLQLVIKKQSVVETRAVARTKFVVVTFAQVEPVAVAVVHVLLVKHVVVPRAKQFNLTPSTVVAVELLVVQVKRVVVVPAQPFLLVLLVAVVTS